MNSNFNYHDYFDANKASRYAVDIGARDGPGPTFPLFMEQGFSGLCIEGYEPYYRVCCQNIPQSNVAKHCEFITPNNIIPIFQKYNVPKDMYVLKIDIDGYDYSIIDTLLASYRPIFIVAEINEKIKATIFTGFH